jgi:hypothetical protein
MRTTVDIPDVLYRRLKAKAASEGRTVKSLLLEAAERAAPEPLLRPSDYLKLPLIESKDPGALYLDNDRVNELLEDDLP